LQSKTDIKRYRVTSREEALPWANVPMFMPAVAILACAVFAIGVLALVWPQMERNEEFAIGGPPNPGLRFVKQVVPVDKTQLSALSIDFVENFAETSFELSDNISPSVFNPPTAFHSTLSSGVGVPAPKKSRFLKTSAATAAFQLPLPKPTRKPSHSGPMATVEALDAHFDRLDYDLADLSEPGNHVPRVYLDKLPEDIAEEKSVTLRKRVFIMSILPVVLRVNEDILSARHKLQSLRDRIDSGMPLSDNQRNWLYQMAERYETEPYDWDAFMARVDVVPPSLAIAQAAEESGWGTSRFAREGNALFGQYTYKPSNGMLPEERANGSRHLIRAYTNLIEGVRSYTHNLNYHRAYEDFRTARKWLRYHEKVMDGHTLAGELTKYSERGTAYVKSLRHIIRANELSLLDHARLHQDRWTRDDTVRGNWQS